MFCRAVTILILALFTPFTAFAGKTRTPENCQFFNALSGGADHDSEALSMKPYKIGSFHVNWLGLGGTINAVVKAQVSNNPACTTCWVDKTGATFNVSDATGTGMIVITGDSLAEAYYRLHWDHGTTTGGSVSGYCMAKE